jgi:hypothetical protein
MTNLLFGIFWIACLIFLIVGVFGLGKEGYDKTNQNNKESVKVIGVILFVVLSLTAFFTIN